MDLNIFFAVSSQQGFPPVHSLKKSAQSQKCVPIISISKTHECYIFNQKERNQPSLCRFPAESSRYNQHKASKISRNFSVSYKLSE